jgi:hypothetical protein
MVNDVLMMHFCCCYFHIIITVWLQKIIWEMQTCYKYALFKIDEGGVKVLPETETSARYETVSQSSRFIGKKREHCSHRTGSPVDPQS